MKKEAFKTKLVKPIICVLFISFLFIFQTNAQKKIKPFLDKIANRGMEVLEVPGMAVTIVKGDSVILTKGFGVKTIGQRNKVDEETLFGMASISKSFTGLGLSILVKEGKIKWTDKVTTYLPYFQMYDTYASSQMTIKDLLLHHTGLPPIAGGTILNGSIYDRKEIIKKIRYLKPTSSFREKYAYQNLFFLVAGEIIEQVSGMSWDNFIRTQIFNKIGMSRSSTKYKDIVTSDNRTSPHMKINNKVRTVKLRNYNNMGAAVSINSNAIDIAKYIMFLVNSGNIKGKQIVDSDVVDEILTPQVCLPVCKPDKELKHMKYNFNACGFGWFIRDYHNKKIAFHTGNIDGMHSMILLVPDENLGFCVTTNRKSYLHYAVIYSLLDYYLKLPKFDYIKVYKAKQEREEQIEIDNWKNRVKNRQTQTKPLVDILEYTGTYFDVMYGDVYIQYVEKDLNLEFSHTPEFNAKLEHWHNNTFLINWENPIIPKGFINFISNANGEIVKFNLEQLNLNDVDFSELNFTKVQQKK